MKNFFNLDKWFSSELNALPLKKFVINAFNACFIDNCLDEVTREKLSETKKRLKASENNQ